MPVVRGAVFLLLLLAAAILQVSFFSFFSFDGVVPNLVLLVVVAAGLTRGPELAALLGFAGGLVIDLAAAGGPRRRPVGTRARRRRLPRRQGAPRAAAGPPRWPWRPSRPARS